MLSSDRSCFHAQIIFRVPTLFVTDHGSRLFQLIRILCCVSIVINSDCPERHVLIYATPGQIFSLDALLPAFPLPFYFWKTSWYDIAPFFPGLPEKHLQNFFFVHRSQESFCIDQNEKEEEGGKKIGLHSSSNTFFWNFSSVIFLVLEAMFSCQFDETKKSVEISKMPTVNDWSQTRNKIIFKNLLSAKKVF